MTPDAVLDAGRRVISGTAATIFILSLLLIAVFILWSVYKQKRRSLLHKLYLALVLMTVDITALSTVAGQMGIILLAQAVLIVLFAIFISFPAFGHDYGAAVMAAGNCGWGCGSGPNAVANEKAVMDQYGWHNVAWILYPSFAVIIDDIYNPIFLSLFGSFFAG